MVFKNYTLQDRETIKKIYSNFKEGFNPYSISVCFDYMSPIEKNIWSIIREKGINMYPQFPVGKYFLDFADPIKKIGIEVDGEEYHLDKEKDGIRQEFIEKEGWIIYRIDGKDTYHNSRFIESVERIFDNIIQEDLELKQEQKEIEQNNKLVANQIIIQALLNK